jgi:hypothetical protein
MGKEATHCFCDATLIIKLWLRCSDFDADRDGIVEIKGNIWSS